MKIAEKFTKNLQKHLLPDLEINGVPKSLKNSVFTFDYNDLDTLKKILKEQDIAAVKMEVSRNEKPKNNSKNRSKIDENDAQIHEKSTKNRFWADS